MSATRSTAQRYNHRSARSPPPAKQFSSFNAAVNHAPAPPSSPPQKPSKAGIASDFPQTDPNHPKRPSLPLEKKNPLLNSYQGRLRSVKTQKIPLENNFSITIARVKVPSSHRAAGHLIKRFDTNAVSATSFFRAAFPDASEEEVNVQMAYISSIWDTATAGGDHIGPECKLTGTWVSTEHAEVIADWYGLARFARELISFPDPGHSTAADSASLPADVTKPEPPSMPTESTPRPKPTEAHAPRSSKRARVAPPSFGNTSPSRFSLPPPAPAQQPPSPLPSAPEALIKIHPLPLGDEPDPTEEPMTISNDEAEEPEHNIAKMKGTEIPSSHEEPETITTPMPSLVGTDEQVERAKREALSLVASLQETAVPVDATSPTSLSDSEITQKKRGIEQVEDMSSQSAKAQNSSAPLSRGFFGRLWLRRKTTIGRYVSQAEAAGHPPRVIAPLPTTLLPRVTPVTKRNLAVAGIIVAGAAASIAPYFF